MKKILSCNAVTSPLKITISIKLDREIWGKYKELVRSKDRFTNLNDLAAEVMEDALEDYIDEHYDD